MTEHGYWLQEHGGFTGGGDPAWYCSICNKGFHVYGIEHQNNYRETCPDCGAINEYPYRRRGKDDKTK